MRWSGSTCVVGLAMLVLSVSNRAISVLALERHLDAKSGIRAWVDPATPERRQVYTSSRGDSWELVMSDEFNTPGRSFKPGEDHIWTSIEKPDGVNAALEVYSHNMTSTACDNAKGGSDSTCYLFIKVQDEIINVQVWNDYQNPPGYKDVTFYYRAAMVQSWNKFCFQGGMVEVRAQLPGVTSPESGSPDLEGGLRARAKTTRYYPTWPGVWMMGNLGRAIFSASTMRMWPFSYNECNDTVFPSYNQRISACNTHPGSGMNPNQGRGAPEIDILEGGGAEISSSMQIGPGMPASFRIKPPKEDANPLCVYTSTCTTPGANTPDIPTNLYAAVRGHKSWYQGIKYAANNLCRPDEKLKQDYKTVMASLAAGVTENECSLTTCPASKDPNADLSIMGKPSSLTAARRWGINSNGTCYPVMNGYTGAYLCSPGNPSSACEKTDVPQSDTANFFEYQMDALSANWPVHMAAYTDYLVYQVEWVPGSDGYIRWMLSGQPLFEIPASSITDPPQDLAQSNPVKIMIEEPMYMIFNVALSGTWGTQPPNPGKPCRGDGTDPVANKICDAFPMYLKIDYIRVYQDTSANSLMAVGCDPTTHPTKQWIADHIDEYEDAGNKAVEVDGRAFCRSDMDCTYGGSASTTSAMAIRTGACVHNRCKCTSVASWSGPRCTTPGSRATSGGFGAYGPPCLVVVVTFGFAMVVTFVVVCMSMRKEKKLRRLAVEKQKAAALAAAGASANDLAAIGVEVSVGRELSEERALDKPVERVLL